MPAQSGEGRTAAKTTHRIAPQPWGQQTDHRDHPEAHREEGFYKLHMYFI